MSRSLKKLLHQHQAAKLTRVNKKSENFRNELIRKLAKKFGRNANEIGVRNGEVIPITDDFGGVNGELFRVKNTINGADNTFERKAIDAMRKDGVRRMTFGDLYDKMQAMGYKCPCKRRLMNRKTEFWVVSKGELGPVFQGGELEAWAAVTTFEPQLECYCLEEKRHIEIEGESTASEIYSNTGMKMAKQMIDGYINDGRKRRIRKHIETMKKVAKSRQEKKLSAIARSLWYCALCSGTGIKGSRDCITGHLKAKHRETRAMAKQEFKNCYGRFDDLMREMELYPDTEDHLFDLYIKHIPLFAEAQARLCGELDLSLGDGPVKQTVSVY